MTVNISPIDDQFPALTIRRIAGNIGAEIVGIKITPEIDEETLSQIDYGTQPRLVRRVTIEGEPAIAVDGNRSRTVTRPEEHLAVSAVA